MIQFYVLMGTMLHSGPELLVINPSTKHCVKVEWGKCSHAVISLKFDNLAQETIVFIRSGSIHHVRAEWCAVRVELGTEEAQTLPLSNEAYGGDPISEEIGCAT